MGQDGGQQCYFFDEKRSTVKLDFKFVCTKVLADLQKNSSSPKRIVHMASKRKEVQTLIVNRPLLRCGHHLDKPTFTTYCAKAVRVRVTDVLHHDGFRRLISCHECGEKLEDYYRLVLEEDGSNMFLCVVCICESIKKCMSPKFTKVLE